MSVAVHFLLISATNRLTGHRLLLPRCLVASILGGLSTAMALGHGETFLGTPAAWILSELLVCLTAFGGSRFFRRSAVFFLLTMALLGLTQCAGSRDLTRLLVCGGLLWGLCALNAGAARGEAQIHRLKLTLDGRTVSLLALHDTGNDLRDPVTGENVVILSPQAACHLTGLNRDQLRQPVQTLTEKPRKGLRLIPYHTVGGQGLLLALRIREGELDGKKKSLLVAFAPEGLGKNEEYQALTGGTICM